jgi:hypothetical protein
MELPESWGPDYKLPDRTADEIEDVYQDLMCDLFHMPDNEAEKIKYQYLLKYTFLKKEIIQKW